MGREIRMVPPNWEHPKNDSGDYQPQFDKSYDVARAEWLSGLAAHKPEDCEGADFWEWEGGQPDRDYYRTYQDQEATWFQLYQTVSEGSPVSPPFATREELAAYLAANGDFWDQKRGDAPWGLARATAFVKDGWAPSFAVINGRIVDGTAIAVELE